MMAKLIIEVYPKLMHKVKLSDHAKYSLSKLKVSSSLLVLIVIDLQTTGSFLHVRWSDA